MGTACRDVLYVPSSVIFLYREIGVINEHLHVHVLVHKYR